MPHQTPARGASWQLLELRARLTLIDTQLIVLLARRFELQREIRDYKTANAMPLHDPARERHVLAHCLGLAQELDVPANVVRELYERVFEIGRDRAFT